MKDLTGLVDLEDVPTCPLCGNAIQEDDVYDPVVVSGSVALAHSWCVDERVGIEDY